MGTGFVGRWGQAGWLSVFSSAVTQVSVGHGGLEAGSFLVAGLDGGFQGLCSHSLVYTRVKFQPSWHLTTSHRLFSPGGGEADPHADLCEVVPSSVEGG